MGKIFFQADASAGMTASDLKNEVNNACHHSYYLHALLHTVSKSKSDLTIIVADAADRDNLDYSNPSNHTNTSRVFDPAKGVYNYTITLYPSDFDGDFYLPLSERLLFNQNPTAYDPNYSSSNPYTVDYNALVNNGLHPFYIQFLRGLTHELGNAEWDTRQNGGAGATLINWQNETSQGTNSVQDEDYIMKQLTGEGNWIPDPGHPPILDGRGNILNTPFHGSGLGTQLLNTSAVANCEHDMQTVHQHAQQTDDHVQSGDTSASPLVLDLSGAGISLTDVSTNPVYFDLNNDGFAEASGWVGASNGVLAIDLNDNNRVDDSTELFGDQTGYSNGFLALAPYDTDQDGQLTANDQDWSKMLVWVDTDHNGFADDGELHTLEELGITAIDLSYSEVSIASSGNTIKEAGSFTINGTTHDIVDAYFATDLLNSTYDLPYVIDPNVVPLPDNRGYGTLTDFHTAMSLDDDIDDSASLISQVNMLASKTFDELFVGDASILAAVQAIMYRWAGVDDVSPTSRGPYFDGQELGFLEAFTGQPFLQLGFYPNPGGVNAQGWLTQAWDVAINHVFATLMAQTAAGELFTGSVAYNIETDSFGGITGLDLTKLSALQSTASGLADTDHRDLFWRDVVRLVEYTIGTANLTPTDHTALENAIHNSDSSLTLSGVLNELLPTPYNGVIFTGTAGNDSLVGGNDNDHIFGGGGSDTIYGGAGNDNLEASVGNDTFIGGTGGDFLQGSGGDDTYVYNLGDGADVIQESTGNDVIQLGAGFDASNLSFSRAANADLVISLVNGATTGEINVSSHFSSPVEYIVFSDGSSLSLTNFNHLQATGTVWNDVLTGVVANGGPDDIINGGDGNDYIDGGTGVDTLHGDNGNDHVIGGDSADTLYGDAGNDIVDGGIGADSMFGGTGNDTFYVDNAGDTITENSAEGTDVIYSSVTFTLPTNVEKLVLTGTSALNATGTTGNEFLVGNSGVNTLTGNGGNDTLDGGAGADKLIGGTGNDSYYVDNASDAITDTGGTDTVIAKITWTLASGLENLTLVGSSAINGTGNTGANIITGNVASNTLSDGGAGSNDTLIGGAGNDNYTVNNSGDVIVEAANGGTDTVSSSVSFTLDPAQEIENLTLTGSSVLTGTGNSLANTITGNTAADSLIGGTGDDTYVITNASTIVVENSGEGFDTIQASGTAGTSFTIAGGVEVLTLTGSTAIHAVGNSADNILNGNAGSNTLNGAARNDTLWGGTAGTDSLIGGTGDDTYIVDRTSGIVIVENSGEGTDTVLASVAATLGANVENLVLTGTSAINGTGNTAANVITGNSAANTLSDGGAGANDTLNGGAGDDSYTVNNSGDVVLEAVGAGTDTVSASVSYALGSGQEIEKLTLTGSSVLVGTGNEFANTITGNTAADTLAGGAGDDTYVITSASTVITENSGEGTDTVSASGTAGTSFTLAAEVENLTLTGATAINGVGNTLANVMSGNSTSNTLNGAGGNDTLWGGTAGTDSLVGGTGDDTYIVDRTSGIVIVENSGEGTDTVQASVTYTIGSSSNIENLTLTGTSAINGTGNSSANVLTGNSAANTLSDGGAGANDTLIGGAGDDIYTVNNGGDVVQEALGGGTDTVSSSVSYTLAAGQEIEKLTLTGSTVLVGTGNEFANTITGNTAADTLVGGAGDDTYIITNASTVITENSGEGIDTVSASGTAGTTFTLAANIENITLTGATAINATGNASDNVLTGNSAANTLTGGDGNDTYFVQATTDVVVEGSGGMSGTDTVETAITWSLGSNIENLILTGSSAVNGTGNSLVNVLVGNTGANTLDGGAGADTLIGGTGNDVYVVDDAGDVVTENSGEGTDAVNAGVSYSLTSNVENLTLTGAGNINGTGNDLANTITGNTGNNTLDGGTGADSLAGGAGDDVYIVDNTGDVVTEALSAGVDNVYSSVSFTIGSNIENLNLTGSANIDATGNTLNNFLAGNSGNNTLNGGTGADTLQGNGGNDIFVVDNAGDVVTAGAGVDTIQSSITWDMSSTGHNNSDVENLTLTGGSVLVATGNTLDNTITANTAADTLIGKTGNDTYVIVSASTVVTENSGEGTDIVNFAGTVAGATYTLAANVENLTLTGTTAINGTGNSGVNIITGNSADNTLTGGGGADTMIGGLGNDTYVVDNTGEVLTETSPSGTDTVQSSVNWTLGAFFENLTLTGSSVLVGTGNVLNNTITGNSAADTLVGGQGSDTYIITNSGTVITENSNEGTDTIQYGVTSAGSFTMASNIENLTITSTAAINITGNASSNSITGNSAINVLSGGGSGNDFLDGGAANDTLIGGTGNDTLQGGTGNDSMTGGAGNDTYYVDSASDVVVENANEGIDTVFFGIAVTGSSYTLGADVENLTLTAVNNKAIGNALDNILIGTGGSSLSGLGGNDILQDGGAGVGTCSMIGGDGDDTYIVNNSSASDILVEGSAAGSGIDLVKSSVTWTLAANFENLTLTGFGAINGTGNSANNIVTGNDAANTLSGGAGGSDTLYGMGGNDSLVGGSSNDYLDGGTGADTMAGSNGNDTYVVDNTGDVVVGGSGIDTVLSSVTWTLGTNTENLTLTGSASITGTGNTLNNIMFGNAGHYTLSGGSGNDTLTGGTGSGYLDGGIGTDTLYGGTGLDTLHGGTGADTFVFQNATAFSARDVIHDFNTSESDVIDFRDVLSSYNPGTDNIHDFVKSENALNGADSIISIDRDGTGSTYGWTQVALVNGMTNIDIDALITSGNLVVH